MSQSSETSDYDSDTPVPSSTNNRHVDLSSSIFKSYLQIHGQDSSSTSSSHHHHDITKIQSFLTSSKSGALSCLICLEKIKHVDPTWHCSKSCFAVFHLHCIQSWAHQSTSSHASRALTRLPVTEQTAVENSIWGCPKCRWEFPKKETPKFYYCYCGKVENPVNDPWVLPHSCGEVCGRNLRGDCGHVCLLLCHPGPCPPCPKLVECECYCGGVTEMRRCGRKGFTCGGRCDKGLGCGVREHRCGGVCHEGECGECREIRVCECECGKVEEERECWGRVFRCGEGCGKRLECGKHVCERGCHKGECGKCPLDGRRECPCGKRVYDGMGCDVEVPLCGGNCEKVLSCGRHRCPDRCHRRACEEICRIVIMKSCRCGGLKKQVHFVFVCSFRLYRK